MKTNISKSKLPKVLCDQLMVSGVNFLTVLLGGMFLEIGEHSILVYTYLVYFMLHTSNVAVVFSCAPLVAISKDTHPDQYGITLVLLQVILTCLTSIFISFIFMSSDSIFPKVELNDVVLIIVFLLLQQLTDFTRRSAYIFKDNDRAIISSLSVFVIRITGLLVWQPSVLSEFLLIMCLSVLLTAAYPILGIFLNFRESNLGLMISHLKTSAWVIFSFPFKWSINHLPVFIAGALIDHKSVAVLVTLRGVSNFSNIFLEAIEATLPAHVAAMKKQSIRQNIIENRLKLYTYSGLVIWLVCMLFLCFYTEYFLKLFFDEVYSSHWYLVVMFWIGNGVFFVTKMIDVNLRMSETSQTEFVAVFIGTIFVLSVIPLIHFFGLAGVVLALIASRLAQLGSQIILNQIGLFKAQL